MKAHTKKAMQPSRYLVVGFFIIIITGSLLLALPVAHRPGIVLSYSDALFTAVSAVCVTGLVTVDVALSFNLFGRTIIALLIMVGGMGFAGMIVSIALFLGLEVGLSQRNMLSEAYNLGTLSGTLKIVKTVVFASLIFQIFGTVAGYWVFRPHYQTLEAWGHSLFHAVSAFNNAGFDLMGDFQSMMEYRQNIVFNAITMFLIISGGLGFFVIADVLRKRFVWGKFTMHTKIVVIATLFLIFTGTVVFLLVERIDFLSALFLSVTARTAGFNTIQTNTLSQATLFFLIMLMFVGASPGSTGGGIKTTTMFAILLSLLSLVFRRQPAAFKRRISDDSILKAFQVLLLAFLVVCSGTFIMMVVEEADVSFLQAFFESVSAFATVGLSTGITPQLSLVSKIVLMLTMFIGRLGPITIATSLSAREFVLKHVEERIFIG